MDSRIVGFRQDTEGHWVAELECGHTQHVRHDPPWQLRPWVLTPESRAQHLGMVLACRLCDEQLKPLSHEQARMCGLCEEGADEVARKKG